MKKLVVPFLVLTLVGVPNAMLQSVAQSSYQNAALQNASLDEATPLDGAIHVPGGTKTTNVDAASESIRTVLHELADEGGFNLVMDESVTGNVTVELNNVTVDQALQSIAALGDILLLKQQGNIFLAISRQAAQDKGIARQLSKVIKINYTNASRIADTLNSSIFASNSSSGGSGGSGTGTMKKATADPRTNSIVVVGTAQEIELAQSAVNKLDVPRQSKTFYLSNANAVDIATMLASSIFNDGTASVKVGGASGGSSTGSSSGGAGGAAAMPSTLRIEKQDIQEGSGINSFGGGSSGGSSGASAGLSSTVTLRGVVKSSDTMSISPEGPLIIPDTRQNSVTIMGTSEQIAQAEALIPTLDAQLPQVAIEASLIEITATGNKQFTPQVGISDGQMQSGFNNSPVEGIGNSSGATVPGGTGLIGMRTVDPSDTSSFARTGMVFSTNPLSKQSDYLLQLRSLVSNNKAKILANPTVVAAHDTESIISIVDEIVRRVTTQIDPSGFSTQTVEIGEAGIVMDILPKIGEDGTISMRLRPSVTSVLNQTEDSAGNIITLLSKRDMLTQNVRVNDGQTLVIGGLIQERTTARDDKLPLGGDLPIVGAMFRASQKNNTRSELVLLITPHIINNTKVTPVNAISTGGGASQTKLAGGQ
jgi:type II secretory pathway component GspD/PulD (secretin)